MFEGLFQPMHLILILVIALIIFGPGKLPELGKGLGKSIREFKKAMSGDEEKPDPTEVKKEIPRQETTEMKNEATSQNGVEAKRETVSQDASAEKRQYISDLVAHYPYVCLFVLLILGGIGVPFFPEDATFILCGFLIHGDVVEPVSALLVIYIGVLIADFILYLFGRRYCRMAVCHKWFHRFLPPERLAMLEDKFKKRGILFILLGRHLIGLRAQLFLVSGIMRMHPLKFLLADAFTVTFTIAVMVSMGYMGGHSLKDIGVDTSKLKYLMPLLFITFLMGYLLIKYVKRKKERKFVDLL